MTQITKDQHFVPKFYLKQFAREKKIQVFDVRARRIGKPRPYVSVCYEKFFYAAETGVQDESSQILELMFGRIESKIAGALPGIIERAVAKQLSNFDLDALACFMGLQWVRTPYLREQVQAIESAAIKQILRKLGSLGVLRSTAQDEGMLDKQIERLEQVIQSGRYNIRSTTNASHLTFIAKELVDIINLLLAKRWRIYFSEGPYHFITSDNPVAVWSPPGIGLIPVTFMDRRHLLALTPNILIEAGRPDSMNPEQQPVDRLSYHAANKKGILMFNNVLAKNAHEYAYSHQRDEFEQLLNLSRSRGALSPAGP